MRKVWFFAALFLLLSAGAGFALDLLILSPGNTTINYRSGINLNFSVNGTYDWAAYSLNFGENQTITGNTTFNVTADGSYELAVYARDGLGRESSDFQYFSVDTAAPLQTLNDMNGDSAWPYNISFDPLAINLSLNENGTCRMSPDNKSYESMEIACEANGTSAVCREYVRNGSDVRRYIACADGFGNIGAAVEYNFSVSVARGLNVLTPTETTIEIGSDKYINIFLWNTGESNLKDVEVRILGDMPPVWYYIDSTKVDIMKGETKKVVLKIYVTDAQITDLPKKYKIRFEAKNSLVAGSSEFTANFIPYTSAPAGTAPAAAASAQPEVSATVTPEIQTNATLDKTQPVSYIKPISPLQNSTSFLIKWVGNDDTEVAYFDIQSRKDNGEWKDWLMRTALKEAVFNGEDGSNYSFRIRAADRAGNMENYHADITTRIMVGSMSMPAETKKILQAPRHETGGITGLFLGAGSLAAGLSGTYLLAPLAVILLVFMGSRASRRRKQKRGLRGKDSILSLYRFGEQFSDEGKTGAPLQKKEKKGDEESQKEPAFADFFKRFEK